MKCNVCCGNIDKKYMVNDGCNDYVVGFRLFLMGANDLSPANIELKRLAYLRMASEGEEE
jgi:hypothetical protein